MKTLLDHDAPRGLRHQLADHDVQTTGHLGWETLRNGEYCLTHAGEAQSVHERSRSPGANPLCKKNGTRPCVPPTPKSRTILGKENKEWLYD